MASCKTYAPYVLVLSLFVVNNHIFAHFDKLTPQSRMNIIRDTAFVSVAAAAISGSLAVYSDVSAQKPKGKETAWQKLKRVDWKQVAKVSIGTGATGVLITSIYCYYNAPEWACNALEDKYAALKRNLTVINTNPVIQGLRHNDPTELNNACAQESFGLVAAFDYLDKTLNSCSSWQEHSKNEIASIKQNLQSLMASPIDVIAQKARILYDELNSNAVVNDLNTCKTQLQNWIMGMRTPAYYAQLEMKTLMANQIAQAAAATKTATAQEIAAHAKQRIADAEQTKATAQLIAAQAKLAQARK